jgi:GDPmannose 4,6-dehydratase
MPRALITGISGQDGSYLTELLLADGYEVHGTVRSRSPEDIGTLESTPQVVLHEVDFATGNGVSRLVDDVEPDEIYNLAALSSVAMSWQQPVLTARIDALAVAQLLESVLGFTERTGRDMRIVQASSAQIFGDAAEVPQVETTALNPDSPYGAAKAYAHSLVQMYRRRGLFAVNAILYNHESPRRPETFVTRKITAAASRISLGLQDRLELGDLSSRRDWGWAPDYVAGMRLAVKAESADDYIFATGEAHSIADFTAAAFARAGISDWERYVVHSADFVRPTDPALQLGDATRARTKLGWSPTVGFSDLVDAMVDADLRLLTADSN